MQICTIRGNTYTYQRQTNEILCGEVEKSQLPWNFAPLEYFDSLPNVETFVIGVTEQCNLRCTYCCYSGDYANNRSHSTKSMGISDIDSIFDFINQLTPNRKIRISFYGGEPLLKHDLIRYAVEIGYKMWHENVSFSISTNGVLLSPDIIDWIVANNIELAVSIDGIGHFHDKNRVDINGKGSFDKIYRALSYIEIHYPEYLPSITILMTLKSFSNIDEIAEAWHNDPLLRKLSPSMINKVVPNFNNVVEKVQYEDVKEIYSHLLDVYERNKDWSVLKVFLNQSIAYWKDRPILAPNSSVPMATCLPINTKLYIDSRLQVGVCEKMSDKYRIGDVNSGINWSDANSIVRNYYNKRVHRCKYCSAVRMCDMCLTAVEYTDEQWDILCHNERVYTRVFMYLFCEMAERGLIELT